MARKLQSSRVPWHPGYPFKPRGGRFRRAASAVTLAALMTLIGGYWYVTDSNRVRKIAEEQLSRGLGSRVKIQRATLSIFDGIRLEGVSLYVDQTTKAPDALLATVGRLQVQVPIGDLIQGEFSRAELLAVEPRVTLVQDRESGRFNVQRIIDRLQRRSTTRPSKDDEVTLPKVIVRGGRFEVDELVGDRLVRKDPIGVEGTLTPDPNREGYYTFDASARNLEGRLGSTASGTIDLVRGEYSAQLRNFDLEMIKRFLPREVREWVDRHDLKGTIAVPEFKIDPEQSKGAERTFRVAATLSNGALSLRPQDLWLKSEIREAARAATREAARAATQPAVAVERKPSEWRSESTTLPAVIEPWRFTNASGRLVFTEKGIELTDMSMGFAGNVIQVGGSITGYSPEAPLSVTVSCDALTVPPNPPIVASLPADIREIYYRFLPQGEGRLKATLTRDETGGIVPHLQLDITRGQMTFEQFPLTVHDITGQVLVTSEAPGRTRLEVRDVRGRGARGGANEKADLRVQGVMSPLEGGSGVDFKIVGTNVTADDALVAAMPAGVREALAKFAARPAGAERTAEEGGANGGGAVPAADRADAIQGPLLVPSGPADGAALNWGEGGPSELPLKYPAFSGSFQVEVHRDEGRVGNWRWPIDIQLESGSGAFEEFPYPLENVTGKMGIRSGYVTLDGMKATRRVPGGVKADAENAGAARADADEEASLTVSGRIAFGDKLTGVQPGEKSRLLYDLKVDGGSIPIDRTLIESIPEERREWLENLGLTGTLDVTGAVSGFNARYELGLAVREGTMSPRGSTWSATDVAGSFRLTPDSFAVERATARRGEAPLEMKGLVDWSSGKVRVAMDVLAKGLPLDGDLRSALPEEGRQGWDEVRPEGRADVAVSLVPEQPATITIQPLGLAVTPSVLPVRLEDVRGTVTVRGDDITLSDVTARRGEGTIALRGTGSTRSRGVWDVVVGVRNAMMDEEVRTALPSMLRETFVALAAQGRMDLELRRLRFKPGAATDGTATETSAAQGQTGPSAAAGGGGGGSGAGADVDFDLSLLPRDMTLSLGVPVHATSGRFDLKGAVRDDKLATLAGGFNLPGGEIAGKPFQNVRATVAKRADQAGITFNDISGVLADGQLAGEAAVAFPDGQPLQYSMKLVLRDADVQRLVGKVADQPISGRLTASLSLSQSNVDDPSTRRGAGDITVEGERLAKVPVLLGLVQIANLSLPLAPGSNFNNATVRYNMDGGLITFEQLILRSPRFQMEGRGKLDLDSRVVQLNLWTTPDLLDVPVLSDLLNRPARELLQVEVSGSIDNPKAGLRSFESFNTTVERVRSSNDRGK